MEITETEEPSRLVAVVRATVRMDELPAFYDSAYRAVGAAIGESAGTLVGPAFGWYFGMPTDTVHLAAGFPVEGLPVGPVAGDGHDVQVIEQPGGRAFSALFVGPYDDLASAWQDVEAWRAERGDPGRGDFWEEYISDPSPEGDPNKNETRLVLPVG